MSTVPVEHSHATPRGAICWFEWRRADAAKPSILLVHATGFHARCWDQVVAALPADRHVVALDLPGHGRSYKPDHIRDWAAMSAALVDFVDSVFPVPVQAVGHSMGGYALALAAASRPAAFVHVTLVDPVIFDPAIYANPIFPPSMTPQDHPVSRRRNRWDGPEQMAAHFSSRLPFARWHPSVLHDYCSFGLLPASDGEGWELACSPELEASAYLGNAGFDPYSKFGHVTCPVTVLRAPQGDRLDPLDFSKSPAWPGLAACFRNGTDMMWDDCTHFIPMEAPDRLAALIAQQSG